MTLPKCETVSGITWRSQSMHSKMRNSFLRASTYALSPLRGPRECQRPYIARTRGSIDLDVHGWCSAATATKICIICISALLNGKRLFQGQAHALCHLSRPRECRGPWWKSVSSRTVNCQPPSPHHLRTGCPSVSVTTCCVNSSASVTSCRVNNSVSVTTCYVQGIEYLGIKQALQMTCDSVRAHKYQDF